MKHFSIYVLAVCFLHNEIKILRLEFLFPGVCQSALTDYIIRAKRNTQVYLKAELVHIYY